MKFTITEHVNKLEDYHTLLNFHTKHQIKDQMAAFRQKFGHKMEFKGLNNTYVNTQNLVKKNQYAFCKRKQQLEKHQEVSEVNNYIHKKTLSIILKFNNVFGEVQHESPLKKLSCHERKRKVLRCIGNEAKRNKSKIKAKGEKKEQIIFIAV